MNEIARKPRTIVIYHRADFDGIFCREIAKKFLPDAELIGWDYSDPTPAGIEPEDTLYILDLSVHDLMAHPNLIWIDHHKSAIDKYPATIPGVRIDGVAACRLTWQWFQNQAGRPKGDYVDCVVEEPFAVRLAGQYDVWDKRDPNAELFQHGLRSCDLTDLMWQGMLGENSFLQEEIVNGLLEGGKVLQFAKDKENASIIKAYGFTVRWHHLTFLVVNHARFNSLLFTAGLKPEHDACLGFNWDGQKNHWRFSLYHAPGKEHHDLSEIAKIYGGGGHRGAAGFTSPTIPFFQ